MIEGALGGELVANQFLQSFASPLLTLFFQLITYLGHPAFWFIIAAYLFWTGRERKSFTIATIILFSGVIVGELKLLIARPRPETLLVLDYESTYAMPSGHSALSAAFASYAWLNKKVTENLKIIMLFVFILVAISRLYLGVHYLSDIFVGALIGIIIGWFILKIEGKLNALHFHVSKLEEEFLIIILLSAMVIAYVVLNIEYNAAYTIFGYYLGYIAYRHSGINIEKTKTTKQTLVATIIGILIIGVLSLIANSMIGIQSQGLFFFIGFFITRIWPIVIDKAVKKRESIKTKKRSKSHGK